MSQDCCDPVLELDDAGLRQRRILRIVLAINAATFIMMVVASYRAHSSSLLSGGLDNAGDALTYGLSLMVIGSSMRAKARVAVLKGALILLAALAVAFTIVWRLLHPAFPVFETIGVFALLNMAANGICLILLTPLRRIDVNMASAWECSRNDIFEGGAVLVTAGAIWLFDAAWPDLVVAVGLLVLFTRSSLRVLKQALGEYGKHRHHGHAH